MGDAARRDAGGAGLLWAGPPPDGDCSLYRDRGGVSVPGGGAARMERSGVISPHLHGVGSQPGGQLIGINAGPAQTNDYLDIQEGQFS